MAALSDLGKVLIIRARVLEEATTGAGDTFLLNGMTTFAAMAADGGRQMVTAATASKSFSFMTGIQSGAASRAFSEAWAAWKTYDEDQLAAAVDRPRIDKTLGRF